MALVGQIILYIIMACCVAGAVANVVKEDSGLAQSFHDGIATMSIMFIPICGLMISVPYIVKGTEFLFGRLFRSFGADPSIAAAMILPPDCGGYAVALEMGGGPAVEIIAIAVGFMVASTIAFNIPIGLSILDKRDHSYLALGAMSGFLSAPFGVLISYVIMYFTHPAIRRSFTTVGTPDHVLDLQMSTIFINLIPIFVICILLALGLKFIPNGMIKGFKVFGKVWNSVLALVVAAAIVEHYTGLFTNVFGGWGFEPLLADGVDNFRAIELLGTIAMMLAGAFPMVYLIRTYLSKPLSKLGKLLGLGSEGSAGLIAGLANGLALFPLIRDMKPKDKVTTVAFVVCAGYSLGDFIAFNVNFQPNLVLPIFIGQILGGVIGILFARIFAYPQLAKLEQQEAEAEAEAEKVAVN